MPSNMSYINEEATCIEITLAVEQITPPLNSLIRLLGDWPAEPMASKLVIEGYLDLLKLMPTVLNAIDGQSAQRSDRLQDHPNPDDDKD